MAVKALFFDQDGVIVDTERDGHRVAFNDTFRQFGIEAHWGVEEYHGLLQTGGGKERMRRYFAETGLFENLDKAALDEKIQTLHAAKTTTLVSMIETGRLPARPGIRRLMREAKEAGLVVGICTTSNPRTADAVVRHVVPEIEIDFVLAGEVVGRKKPDPEIYRLAVQRAGIAPEEGMVIEDSAIGTRAARAAGLHVVATVNDYTKEEDMSAADLVLTTLGDAENPTRVIRGPREIAAMGFVTLDALLGYFTQ